MATIDDLIAQVKDPVLRSRLDAEAKKLREKKKFGLVFEDHVPECTPLYEVPLKKGCKAAKRTGTIDKIYDVVAVHDGEICSIEGRLDYDPAKQEYAYRSMNFERKNKPALADVLVFAVPKWQEIEARSPEDIMCREARLHLEEY